MPSLRTRFFQVWFRVSRPMTLGVRGVVENSAGQVLLVRHTYTPGLFFPGGGVERGETALSALARELEEEAGVRASGEPRLHGVYSNHPNFRNDHVLLYRLTAGRWQACPPTSRGEIAERIWADPHDPPPDVTPGTARRLAELYSGGGTDGYW